MKALISLFLSFVLTGCSYALAANPNDFSIDGTILTGYWGGEYDANGYPLDIDVLEIPNGVTKIGEFAFAGMYNIKKIVLPNTVVEIGDQAFNGCQGLESIVLSENLISIGSEAFIGCSNLANVKLPNSVSHVGDEAFAFCGENREAFHITVPKSVQSIGWRSIERFFDDTKMYVAHNSAAEQYAINKNIPYEYIDEIDERFDLWYRFTGDVDHKAEDIIIADLQKVSYMTIWAKTDKTFADPYKQGSRYQYRLKGDSEAIEFIPEFSGFRIRQSGRVDVQIWDSVANELLCSAIVHVVDEKDRIALVASSGTSGWMHVNNNSVIDIKAVSPEQLLKFELYVNEEGAIVRKTIGVDDYSNDGYKMRVTKKHGDAIWNLDEIGALLTQSYEDQLYTLELLSNISGKEKTILTFSVDITADQRLKGDRYRFMYENLYSSYSQNMGKDIIIRFDSNIFSPIDNDLLPVISIFDKLYNRILPIKGPGIDVYVDKSLSTGRIFELDETGILKPLSAGRVLIKLKMNGQQQNDYINVYGVKKLVDSSSIKIGINRPKNGEVYERIDELELQFRDVPDFTQNNDFEFGYMIQYTEGKNAGETEFIHVGTWSATNKKVTRIQLDYYDRVVVSGFIVSKHNPDFYYIGDAYTMDTYARESWDDQHKTDSKRRSEVIIDNINHLNANNLYVMDLMDNFSIVAEMTVSMAETLKNYVDEGEYDFWKTVGIAMELDNYVDEIRTEIIGSTLKCVLNIDGKVIDFAVNEVKFWRSFQESPSVMGFVEHSLTYGQEYVESQLGFKLKIISRDGQLYIADEDETALLDLGSSVAYDDYQEIKDYMDRGSFVSQTIPGYFEIDSPLNLVTEIIGESLPGTIPIF